MTEIVVFGATGQVGSEVVRSLCKIGVVPRVFSRSDGKAASLFGNSVSIVQGDFEDDAALKQVVKGAKSIFLASPVNPRQVMWQDRVLSAVAGSQPLVVKLSGLATTLGSYVDSGRWHAETEAAIARLELPHVFLHPNFFLQNLARSVPAALKSGVLQASDADVAIAPVDVRDIGSVAARLLTGQADRTGLTLRLTTAEPFTYSWLGSLLAELSGEKIELIERSDQETRQLLNGTGMPAWHVDILLQFNRAFRDRLGAEVSTDVESVLGRPPMTTRSYIEELAKVGLQST